MSGGRPSNSSNTIPTVPPTTALHGSFPISPSNNLTVSKSVGGLALGCCVEPSSVIWMMLTLFTVTVFLLVLFCVLTVATRWIYKRRMTKKCDALRAKYLQEDKQHKMDEIRAKRLALRPILPFRPNRNETKIVETLFERNIVNLNDEKGAVGPRNPMKMVPNGKLMNDRRVFATRNPTRTIPCDEVDCERLFVTKSQLSGKKLNKIDDEQLEKTQKDEEQKDSSKKMTKMTTETISADSFLTSRSLSMTPTGSGSPYVAASYERPFETNETRDYRGQEDPTRPVSSGFSHLQAVAKKSLLSRMATETRRVTTNVQ